jgi:hypothetical protein
MTTKQKLPVRRDIEMKRGADWNWTIKLREDDGVTAKDTTGYAVTMTIKNGTQIYDILTIDNGITNTPVSGQLNFRIPYSDVDSYEFSSAEYDVIIVNNLGKHWAPFYGNIRVIP